MSVGPLVFNKHHLPEQIETLATEIGQSLKLPTFVSDESQRILGSGGGLARAREFLGNSDSLWLANGDEVFLPSHGCGLEPVFHSHRQALRNGERRVATLAVIRHPDVGHRFGGVWTDDSGKVRGFGKTGDGHGWHFIGYQLLSPAIFDYLRHDHESNILYDAVTAATKEGWTAQAVEVSGNWYETGSFQDLEEAAKALLTLLVSDDAQTDPRSQWGRRLLEEAGYRRNGLLWATDETHSALGSPESLRRAGHGLFVSKGAWVPSLRDQGGPTVIEASATWNRATSDQIRTRGGLFV
jgi:NDP-sugar pyrophosphorylase family protein